MEPKELREPPGSEDPGAAVVVANTVVWQLFFFDIFRKFFDRLQENVFQNV